ncbi:TPA: hypothetical protein RQO42_005794, partial [Klebsiella michiganensis]|nr:hypothetical protein [Klebsiella michiganensis]
LATLRGKALITEDGEAIEDEALDDICRFLNLSRHAIEVAGILFKAGDAKAHPFRVHQLGKPNINQNEARISSVLRTCQGESVAAAG